MDQPFVLRAVCPDKLILETFSGVFELSDMSCPEERAQSSALKPLEKLRTALISQAKQMGAMLAMPYRAHSFAVWIQEYCKASSASGMLGNAGTEFQVGSYSCFQRSFVRGKLVLFRIELVLEAESRLDITAVA